MLSLFICGLVFDCFLPLGYFSIMGQQITFNREILFFVFFFLALLVLPALIIFLAHVDFFPSPIICTLSPLPFHPSFIPLVFPSPSILAPLIPTGVVIPSPQRRLNDFILLRLSLLLLMMCLVPSHFDVD